MKPLSCIATRRRLSAYLDGELPVAGQVAVDGHLRNCRACADELAAMRGVGDMLRARSVAAAAHCAPDLCRSGSGHPEPSRGGTRGVRGGPGVPGVPGHAPRPRGGLLDGRHGGVGAARGRDLLLRAPVGASGFARGHDGDARRAGHRNRQPHPVAAVRGVGRDGRRPGQRGRRGLRARGGCHARTAGWSAPRSCRRSRRRPNASGCTGCSTKSPGRGSSRRGWAGRPSR